jgi:predicted nicotinamide N-methyase
MAGGDPVEASEIDDFARAAIALNATANGVAVEIVSGDLIGRDLGWDVVLAGDICYERDLAARVIGWLERLAREGRTVLIGDPGRSYLPTDRLCPLATYAVPVTRTLEDADVKRSTVWCLRL